VTVVNDSFFNEITLRLNKDAAQVVEELASRNILGGVPVSRLISGRPELSNLLLVAATETTTPEHIDALAAALEDIL
jgi:glycine dehydrogenase subunit 1